MYGKFALLRFKVIMLFPWIADLNENLRLGRYR